jgi:predicted site-specific integrase-resolvase
MKSGEILKQLRISRPTLTKYVKEGKIKVRRLENGHYHYDDESVYAILNDGVKRKTVIYTRVSTSKQKIDLENQIELLKNFCFQNGYQVNTIYSDIASGISFDKRKAFFELLDEVINKKVERVVISYKDRLSRIGFELFSTLFLKFGTEIIVLSEVGSKKLDSEEIFEEIVSLLHCYSMKLYSKRKNKKIEELIEHEG